MATDIDFTQEGQETPVMQKTTLTYYTIMSEWGCAWKNWGFWFSAQITRDTQRPLCEWKMKQLQDWMQES